MLGDLKWLNTFFNSTLPLAGSVRTSSAPKALNRILRSSDMEAGMVSTSLYPLAAAMKASPMPVLPDVGSTRVVCSNQKLCHMVFRPKQLVAVLKLCWLIHFERVLGKLVTLAVMPFQSHSDA